MHLKDKVAVITGAGGGIGRAMAQRFSEEEATVVIVDIDADAAAKTSGEVGGMAIQADVANREDITRLVEVTVRELGRIDLFCSNAGILIEGGVDLSDSDWERIFDVNVMAHVYAARTILPHMLKRGSGYFLQTVSAAGLLSQIGSAPYSVTKHAALGFAEWLSITYGDRGIRVSALCPQGVRTAMLLNSNAAPAHFLNETALTPEQVAEAAVRGIAEEKFLILPHPEVAEYFRRKATDYDRWLGGMRRLKVKLGAQT